jgi:hypothetical protein
MTDDQRDAARYRFIRQGEPVTGILVADAASHKYGYMDIAGEALDALVDTLINDLAKAGDKNIPPK